MKADEIEIATAKVIILDYGEGNFPEIDTFIWQPARMKYKRIRPDKLISEFSPDIICELIHRLFMVEAVKDYSIQYEISDRRDRSLIHTAYLYLKEEEKNE